MYPAEPSSGRSKKVYGIIGGGVLLAILLIVVVINSLTSNKNQTSNQAVENAPAQSVVPANSQDFSGLDAAVSKAANDQAAAQSAIDAATKQTKVVQ